MAEEQSTIRHISWLDLFPWLGLVRAVRLAFAPRNLILSAVGLAAMNAGWQLIGAIFSGSSDRNIQDMIKGLEGWPAYHLPSEPPQRSLSMLDPVNSPATIPWNELSAPFRGLFGENVTVSLFTYLLCLGIWALLVWSLFGAAITRDAALWFAR
jgi:hypothetical protein